MKYFGMHLLFLTFPKPVKQYTLFEKDDPFSSSRRRLSEPEADKWDFTNEIPRPLNCIILKYFSDFVYDQLGLNYPKDNRKQ